MIHRNMLDFSDPLVTNRHILLARVINQLTNMIQTSPYPDNIWDSYETFKENLLKAEKVVVEVFDKNSTYEVSSAEFNTFIADLRRVSLLNNIRLGGRLSISTSPSSNTIDNDNKPTAIIPDRNNTEIVKYDNVFEFANKASIAISEEVEKVSSLISEAEILLDEAKIEVLSNIQVQSIYDEVVFTINPTKHIPIVSGNLQIDTQTNIISLPIIRTDEIDINSIMIKPKTDQRVEIDDEYYNKKTNEFITEEGVYYGHIFTEDPIFEDPKIDYENTLPQNIDRGYVVTKYANMDNKDSLLVLDVNIDTSEPFNLIQIESSNSALETKWNVTNLTQTSLSLKNIKYTEESGRPRFSGITGKSQISIAFTSETFWNLEISTQEFLQTEWREYVIKNRSTPIHEFNIYESAYLRSVGILEAAYVSDYAKTPYNLDTAENKNKIRKAFKEGIPFLVTKNKYYSNIGLSSIKAYNNVYEMVGSSVFGPFVSKKQIKAVELYADIDTAQNIKIRFEVSADNNNWNEIYLSNDQQEGVKRISFIKDLTGDDTIILESIVTNIIFIRVSIESHSNFTPSIRKIVIRAKV